MVYRQRIKILFLCLFIGSIEAQIVPEVVTEKPQACHLFTTIFMGTSEQGSSNKGFIEYENEQLPEKIGLYDRFFQKNFPEISARKCCLLSIDTSKSESLEDAAAALLGHLDAFRLRCNKEGIEPIIQCEVSGDRAAEIFLACMAYSEVADFPQSINTVSFYDVSDAMRKHKTLTSQLIRRAYFFMPKSGSKLPLNNQQKDMARIVVLCDTLPKTIAHPWWVLAPVFLRHLWVLASSTAEISLSTFFTDSAVLTCGKNKIDVSNALFPILKSFELTNQKNKPLSTVMSMFASLNGSK